MADILIRGMEMPDGCHHCRFSYLDKGETNDGEPCTVIMCSAMEQGTNGAEYDGSRPSWCPIVPLPEGHGKLVDAREVLEKADKAPWFDGDVAELGLLLGSEVTTIIQAEGWLDNG